MYLQVDMLFQIIVGIHFFELFLNLLSQLNTMKLKFTSLTFSRKSKDQTLPIGSRESFTWIILKTILCLVLDPQGFPSEYAPKKLRLAVSHWLNEFVNGFPRRRTQWYYP